MEKKQKFQLAYKFCNGIRTCKPFSSKVSTNFDAIKTFLNVLDTLRQCPMPDIEEIHLETLSPSGVVAGSLLIAYPKSDCHFFDIDGFCYNVDTLTF